VQALDTALMRVYAVYDPKKLRELIENPESDCDPQVPAPSPMGNAKASQ
jgi:hypothetical protein